MGDSRVCLITGGGRGIGAAVARRLAASGYHIALTARSEGQLAEVASSLPGESLVVPADLTADGAVDDVFTTVEERWGPVEILVANAGAGASAPIPRITDDGWGRIVVIASIAAKRGEPYIAAYTAAKHGVLGLVRAAAAETARTGVTVNAVCPAYVGTPMTDGSVEAIAASTGRTLDEARTVLERKQPIGRLITVDEVAATVALCIDNAAITGQGINVDGGAVQS